MQPAVRLFLLLARIGDRAASFTPHSSDDGLCDSQEPLDATVAVVDAALAVLMLSPPGELLL